MKIAKHIRHSWHWLKSRGGYLYAFISLSLTVALLIVAGVYWLINSEQKQVQAASTPFAGGQVSIDKKYYKNGFENDTVTVGLNEIVTVRLRYDNTGGQSAISTQINDSIPSGFTILPGTLKNCFADGQCVSLNDNLFSGSSLSLGPATGLFGYQNGNSASTTNLEMGRKRYIHSCAREQINSIGADGAWLIANNNSSMVVNNTNCDFSGTGIFTLQSANGSTNASGAHRVYDISGFRYLHSCARQQQDVIDMDGAWLVPSNSGAMVVNNVNCNLSGTGLYQLTGANSPTDSTGQNRVVDILGKRYLHSCARQQENLIGADGAWLVANMDSSIVVDNASCNFNGVGMFNTVSANATTNLNGQHRVTDLLDTTRGYGYIEYRMTAPNIIGTYGTNVSMTSTSFSSITDIATGTINILGVDTNNLICDFVNPAGGTRTVTLSDAELRTDQNFTCNYSLKICPIVFMDINGNGIQDNGETNMAGRNIQLLNSAGDSILSTLQTDLNGNNCFTPLVGGRTYKVTNVDPVTIYNTTEGNTLTINTVSEGGEIYAYFGYSNGVLSLSVPPTATLPSASVASIDTLVCTTLDDITVTDTRLNVPGWSLTATVDDFKNPTDQNIKIIINSRFQFDPKPITTQNGSLTGVARGSTKYVNDTSDPATIMTAQENNGTGAYVMNPDICLNIPPFTKAAPYNGIIYYTLV